MNSESPDAARNKILFDNLTPLYPQERIKQETAKENISGRVMDLLTPFVFRVNGEMIERRIVGGLLGHWAVWTRRAVELLKECQAAALLEELSQDKAQAIDSRRVLDD